MDTKINDGGSAFPRMDVTERNICIPRDGMSLRDYFAGQALIGLISNADRIDGCETRSGITRVSYRYADSMIKARDIK